MMSSIPAARFRFAVWPALAAMVIWLALRLGSAALADPIAPSPPQEAPVVAAEKISADIRYLASKELEGRGSGTPGGRKAAAFIAERFRAVGLQPPGDEGSYFQRS